MHCIGQTIIKGAVPLLRPTVYESCCGHYCRLDDESRENQRRRDELADLKCDLRQKERCIAELSGDNDCLKSELELTSTKLDKYQCEMEAANQRCVA